MVYSQISINMQNAQCLLISCMPMCDSGEKPMYMYSDTLSALMKNQVSKCNKFCDFLLLG